MFGLTQPVLLLHEVWGQEGAGHNYFKITITTLLIKAFQL